MSLQKSRGIRRKLVLTVRLAGASSLAGAVVAGFALPAVGAVGLGVHSVTDGFDSLPEDFVAPPLSQASTVYDATGGTIAVVYSRNRTVVASDAIAPVMKSALVDIEDNRFYHHGAADLKGMLRALSTNARAGGTAQGASTLTQQYVKNVFVDKAGDDQQKVQEAQRQTIGRKVQELKYAIKVEEELTKDQILTNYLNITFFGEQAYGIEAAAQRYFGVHAADLTVPQAALLAGLVQSPTAYDPIVNPKDGRKRRDTVLYRMAELGTISRADAARYAAQDLGLNVQRPREGCITAADGEGFFCDYVRKVVLTDPAFGASAAERQALWARGGLQIHTTLDPKSQRAAVDAVHRNVYASDKAAAAMTLVQPGTGRILAMAQSRPYGLGANETVINYNVGRSMGGGLGFPTGSTFKPIVAAAALESGIPADRTYTTPAAIQWPAMKDCDGNRRAAKDDVHNDSPTMTGSWDMKTAVARSVNTYFAQLEEETGLCDVAQTARSLGLDKQADGSPMQVVQSMVLGVNSLTPLGMSAAYATFAAHGTYCTPQAVTSVTGPDGKQLKVPAANCKQVLSARTTDTLTAMLKGVVADGGTAPNLGLSDRDSAGKTGTTDKARQVWFVGYTPELSGAVVVGDTAKVASLNNRTIGGRNRGEAFGGSVAGPIWKQAMQKALEGTPAGDFTPVQLP